MEEPLDAIHAALDRHPGLERDRKVTIRMEDHAIVLEGTVRDISTKRLIPRIAIEASGGLGIADRLTVESDAERDDAAIAEDIVRSLTAEPLFAAYAIWSKPHQAAGQRRRYHERDTPGTATRSASRCRACRNSHRRSRREAKRRSTRRRTEAGG